MVLTKQPSARPKIIVYVDGFNLYYGAIKGGDHKWLNLERYLRMLRVSVQIEAIYYFTALIDGPTRQNQIAYFAKQAECLTSREAIHLMPR